MARNINRPLRRRPPPSATLAVLAGPQKPGSPQDELPAFVVDVAAGAIVDANAAGWIAFGLDAASVVPPVAIDKAAPGLHRLVQLARGGVCGESETLAFWGRRGRIEMRSEIARLQGRPAAFLIRALEVRPRGSVDAPAGFAGSDAAPEGGSEGRQLDTAATDRLAHELRTPLAAVIAYAEVLKDEHFGPLSSPRYREYAHHIHESARHALSVVDGLLGGSASDKGVPELAFRDLDPAGVVENCLSVARPLAQEAGLDLVASVCPRAPRVVADELSLKQMLLNLITNAIKFARPGDKVTVGVDYDLDGPLRFAVVDTGPGMGLPASEGPRSRRTGAPRPGLGIGLPLTRALAEANGAALLIDSAPGRGTCATIAFGKDRIVPV